ncbi:Lachrymatory-factor synthase [Acorus gramineus]|uniref:Lachrymatory-factor synthase n=1 Tax=Acorus gramineus TaxID=55184 RepID=A0AAV9ATU6_ACOGR|nr:Lachrymatory-factor synthase [Acorus gramineus]
MPRTRAKVACRGDAPQRRANEATTRRGGEPTYGMTQGEEPKLEWEGKVTATLTNTTADQAWSLLKDFTNLHKILPTLQTCHLVEGDGVVIWAKERLIEINPVRRFLRYVIEENKIRFRRYFVRIGAVDGSGGGGGGGGCVIEWSYVADPIEGWPKEGFEAYLRTSLEAIARRIEEILQGGGGA